MHQGCFTFRLLTPQDATLQLSGFLSDAAGCSSLHILETSQAPTCCSTEISGSFKHFWSDLPGGFRGSSPSRATSGEHKWDKTRIWRREAPGWKSKCHASQKSNTEKHEAESIFAGSHLARKGWEVNRNSSQQWHKRVSFLLSFLITEAQKLATSCCGKWAGWSDHMRGI